MSTVNVWKYAREVYLIGRSHKFRYLTDKERQTVITFITGILETRPAIAQRLNLKYENAGKVLEKQNSYALLKMVQVIGRNLKVQFVTEEQKALCDTLITAVAPRAAMGYKDYKTDEEEVINNIGTGYFSSNHGALHWDENEQKYVKIGDPDIYLRFALEEDNRYAVYFHMGGGENIIGYTNGDLNYIDWIDEEIMVDKDNFVWHP